MVNGEPKARAVQFFLDSNVVPINLIGDGLLPADIDGKRPSRHGDSDLRDAGRRLPPYGATFDALNIWDLYVKWHSTPTASMP